MFAFDKKQEKGQCGTAETSDKTCPNPAKVHGKYRVSVPPVTSADTEREAWTAALSHERLGQMEPVTLERSGRTKELKKVGAQYA